MEIKKMRELGFKVHNSSSEYANINLYSTDIKLEDFNLNKDTEVVTLEYEHKIGFSQGDTMRDILSLPSGVYLNISVAGSGKTHVTMEASSDIAMKQKEMIENLKGALLKEVEMVAYVLAVPTLAQAIQNEIGEDLKDFHFTKVIGRDHGEQSDINESIPLYTPVFDSTLRVVRELKAQGYKVKLIVDECHKLIGDIGYRARALSEIEQAMELSDLVIHMTATERKCLNLYKYDKIFKFVDTKQKNNIKDFRVIYTNNWEITLIKNAVKLKNKGFIPLIRLNSYKDIEAMRKVLGEKYDIETKILSSETKNDEIFASIQENGTVGNKLIVLFCTSVIECGISIKQTNIVPIEVIREASDYNKDDSIQFFARPRLQVSKGIMIVKNYRYVNPNGKSITELRDFKQVFKSEYPKIMREYDNLMNEAKYNLEEYGFVRAKEQLKAKMAVLRNNRVFINVFDVDYTTLMVYINKKKVLNYIYSVMDSDIIIKSPLMFRKCLKKDIFYDTIEIETEQHYKSLDDMIENGLELNIERIEDVYGNDKILLVNNKVIKGEGAEEYKDDIDVKIIKAIYHIRDNQKSLADILSGIYLADEDKEIHELMLGYEKYDIIKAYADGIEEKKKIREERGKINDEIKLRELIYREFLMDDNFNKALRAIINQEIDSKNIKDYKLKQSLSEIIDFRESELCEVLIECSEIFGAKEAIKLITSLKPTGKKKNKLKYLSYSYIRKLCRLKYFIDKDKKNIEYGDDLYDCISQIVESNRKNGKQVPLTKNLGVILITELIRNKYYNGIKGAKDVKKIIADIEMEEKMMKSLNLDYMFYNKENIKKLEDTISSNLKNRLIDDLNDIYKVGADTRGYTIIKSFKKDFNLNDYLK